MIMNNDYLTYAEHSLSGRTKLTFDWIPDNSESLLDIGCAWAYSTRIYKSKSVNTYGIDPNIGFILIGKHRYPGIFFSNSSIEAAPFKYNSFDVIVLNDVLEHIQSEIDTINEIFRILKPGGTLIITVPHKGLFSFLDTLNYSYIINKYFPKIYKILIGIKNRKHHVQYKMCTIDKHRHYKKKDIITFFNYSEFKNDYYIESIRRSGLFVGALTSNINMVLCLVFTRKLRSLILKPLYIISKIEYRLSFGIFSYNIALKIIKK